MSTKNYQQVTLTLVVLGDDVEAARRELQLAVANIGEECMVFNDRIEEEDCEGPEDDVDNYYEDAA